MKEKAPLFILPWRCTSACTNNCLHCGFANTPEPLDSLGTEETKCIVDKIHAFGATYFGISGGEPLFRKDLPEIISYAKGTGMNVSIITSGYGLDNKIMETLVKYGVRVSISVDGPEEINDALRGKGAYKTALAAIEKTSKAGLLDCLVATLANADSTHDNISSDAMEHVIKLAEKYGARWVVIHGFIPFNKTKKHLARAPSPEQYEKIWNDVYDLRLKYNGKPEVNVYCPFFARIAKQRGLPDFDNWLNKFFLGRCSMAGKYMSVIENGDVIPCSFNDRIRLGNVQDKSLYQIWDELQTSELTVKLKDRSNLKGKCGVCEYREICGGCRTRAQIYTGDYFGSDPACAYVPKVLQDKQQK
ncbi:MAG: radical SAM protein [Candidatus Bathyarchaeota archaeon]|nr:MAG: radical SAM protein [Candidatus Bathyarchaeota archaeon]